MEPLPAKTLSDVQESNSADIVVKGTIEQTTADPAEQNDPEVQHLPRLRFRFDRHKLGPVLRHADRPDQSGVMNITSRRAWFPNICVDTILNRA